MQCCSLFEVIVIQQIIEKNWRCCSQLKLMDSFRIVGDNRPLIYSNTLRRSKDDKRKPKIHTTSTE